jgi:hypothetical protein
MSLGYSDYIDAAENISIMGIGFHRLQIKKVTTLRRVIVGLCLMVQGTMINTCMIDTMLTKTKRICLEF